MTKSLKSFLDELASSRPVPGGGSVSAIVAAQAAALVSMACEISAKRETVRSKKRQQKALAQSAYRLCRLGQQQAEFDVRVFQRLIAVFKKRYASRARRSQAVQKSLKACTDSCLDLARLAQTGLKISLKAVKQVRPDMRSEIHTALYLWEASFHGAWVNTEANLDWVKDARLKNKARQVIRQVSRDVRTSRSAILKYLRRGGAK